MNTDFSDELHSRMAAAFRGDIEAPTDPEIISALAAVLGRAPTTEEIGRVFAAVEAIARNAIEAVLGKGKGV